MSRNFQDPENYNKTPKSKSIQPDTSHDIGYLASTIKRCIFSKSE